MSITYNREIDRLSEETAAGSTLINPTTGQLSDMFKSFMTFDPKNQIRYNETWQSMNDTHLALEYSLTATADVSTTPGKCTLTTAGSGADTAGIKTLGVSLYRADCPVIEETIELGQLTACVFQFGFYKDANELCWVRFNSADPTTSATNLVLEVNGAGTTQYQDLGVLASTDKVKIRIALDTAGKPYVWIDDVYIPTAAAVTNRVTADGHYLYNMLTESAAAAKTAQINYIEMTMNK